MTDDEQIEELRQSLETFEAEALDAARVYFANELLEHVYSGAAIDPGVAHELLELADLSRAPGAAEAVQAAGHAFLSVVEPTDAPRHLEVLERLLGRSAGDGRSAAFLAWSLVSKLASEADAGARPLH